MMTSRRSVSGVSRVGVGVGVVCAVWCVVLLGAEAVTAAPSCVCDTRDCEEILPADCPGLGVVMWDPCRCCQVCARTEGEPCGGVLGFSGTCEPGLDCQQTGMSSEGICQRDL